MSLQENKAIVHRFIEEVFNNENYTVCQELIDESFNRASRPERSGPDGEMNRAKGFRTIFADLHLEIEQMTAEDDRVVVQFVVTGTHVGAYSGIQGTGKSFSLIGCSVYQISGGKIVGDRITYLPAWSSMENFVEQVSELP